MNSTTVHSDSIGSKSQDPLIALLKEEFLSRRERNPSYSQRAFANYLEIDQSLLSKLLNKKRRLANETRIQVGLKLGMTPFQLENLSSSSTNLFSSENFRQIDDEFQVLSEWHHFPILEYLKIKDASQDPAYIAQRLGIHKIKVEQAIDRLLSLNFLEIKDSKLHLRSPNNTWSDVQSTTLAKKKLQQSLLKKSIHSIDEVDIQSRDHSSLTVAIDKKRIPEFKEKIKQIRAELDQFFQPIEQTPSEEYNEVYQLCVSLFPLTKNINSMQGKKS